MKTARWLGVWVLFGLAMAASGSLTLGLWARTPGFTLGPTFFLRYPTDELTFSLYARASLPGTDETSIGLGLAKSFEGGVLGRGEAGARVFLGVDAQYWLEGYAKGSAGKGALGLRLGYTEDRTPRHFWPLERDSLGFYLDADAAYRLDRRLVLEALYRYQNQVSSGEVSFLWREPRRRVRFGVGAVEKPERAYAVLGYGREVAGAFLNGELRVGAKNEFRLDYAEPGLKAELALAYPPAARAGVRYQAWSFDAELRQDGLAFFLRYTLDR